MQKFEFQRTYANIEKDKTNLSQIRPPNSIEA